MIHSETFSLYNLAKEGPLPITPYGLTISDISFFSVLGETNKEANIIIHYAGNQRIRSETYNYLNGMSSHMIHLKNNDTFRRIPLPKPMPPALTDIIHKLLQKNELYHKYAQATATPEKRSE